MAGESNQAQGAVMIQLLMQYIGPALNLNQWEKIMYSVLDRLNVKIDTNFLKAR